MYEVNKMPFSKRSLDFLFENKLHDSKEWYEEHKDIYREYVTKPFTALAAELEPFFTETDSELICTPKRISRVRRDTRSTKDKSLFRDHIWITVSRPKERFEQIPGFYFCIEQTGFSLGCGYYQADTGSMEAIRKLILESDSSFNEANKALKSAPEFALEGEMYKRSRFSGESAEKQNWLNRKSLCVNLSSGDTDILFGNGLAEYLKGKFTKIVPFYRFLMKAEETAVRESNSVREKADALPSAKRYKDDF